MSAGNWKGEITVELSEDGEGWFAESKRLDYAACGKTVEETKKNFFDGLDATRLLHQRLPRPHACNICYYCKWTMPNIRWEFLDAEPCAK